MEMESVFILGIFFVAYTGLLLMIMAWFIKNTNKRIDKIEAWMEELESIEEE